MKNCCLSNKKANICKRLSDGKIFKLPRKFTKNQCINSKIKGFSMKASCAPFKDCKKTFDVYTDRNPDDTISIKYNTINDVKQTITKLEKLYKQKKYSHRRIWSVSMILMVRLRVLKNQKPKQYDLAKRYFEFIGKRTKLKEDNRYKLIFT
jgi:hypothetical protein